MNARGFSRRGLVAGGVFAGLLAGHAKAGDAAPPQDADLSRVIEDRVAAIADPENGVGVVAALVDARGGKVVSAGRFGQPDPSPPPGEIVFEIASVTKAFTALALCDSVRRGEVALFDPVANHLPPSVTLPQRGGRSITLADLATHTSSLPFMPEKPLEATPQAHFRYLAQYALPRDIGSGWDYSNLGYWLLGEALAHAAGMPFEALVTTRIIEPLRLGSTAFAPSPSMRPRLATGRDASLRPTRPISTLAGYEVVIGPAGGLYSSVDDLATFLATAMGLKPSPLTAAFQAMLATRRPTGEAGHEQALGWVVIDQGGQTIVFHDGGALGFASAVAWDPATRTGACALSNQVTSVADIARHALTPAFPLEKPTITRQVEVTLPQAQLLPLVGRYRSAQGVFAIGFDGAFLTLEAPADWGLPKLQLHAQSPREFFGAILPVRVSIRTDSAGKVVGVLIHPPRGQAAVAAERMSPGS
jgi:CubicO group peptidase (beta-lactamase class C family)